MSFLRWIFQTPKTSDVRGTAARPGLLEVPYSPYATKVWAVGGGKGGVGKSLMASSLGILLTKMGKRVLLIDADIGAANLHTFLGVENPAATLSNFLKNVEETDLRPYISGTGLKNLGLVSGARDALTVVDLNPSSISRLKDALSRTGYDYVIMDTGPGTSANNLDLFLSAAEGVLVTTPEPTSIENTYRFLKCLFLRRIRNICDSGQDSRLKDALTMIFSGKRCGRVKTVSEILLRLRELDPDRGKMLAELMGNTRVSLVVNQAKMPSDSGIGASMSRACRDYFGINVGCLGEVLHDEAAADSIRKRMPLVISHCDSSAAGSISKCLEKLLCEEKKGKAVTSLLINF